MKFYFIVDILRSLNYGISASYQSFDLSIPISSGSAFRQAYEDLIIDCKPISEDNDADDSLLLLLAILSEILTLQNWLGPVGVWENEHHSLQDSATPEANARHGISKVTSETSSDSHALPSYSNPYLSTSATAEYIRISRSLDSALAKWEDHALIFDGERLAPRLDNAIGGIVTLYYFCQLLLSGGPGVLPLAHLVGYCPRHKFQVPDVINSSEIPEISTHTVDIAWQILDVLEYENDRTKKHGSEGSHKNWITPLWNPIITFYAGLVVWARVQSRPAKSQDLGAKRTLKLFEIEMKAMQWPSAATMGGILQQLRQR